MSGGTAIGFADAWLGMSGAKRGNQSMCKKNSPLAKSGAQIDSSLIANPNTKITNSAG
jgi:hypothetical protein